MEPYEDNMAIFVAPSDGVYTLTVANKRPVEFTCKQGDRIEVSWELATLVAESHPSQFIEAVWAWQERT